MPIFGKKKDKTAKNKQVKDRFMQRALNAKRTQAQSTEMLEVEFTERFSEKTLKQIGRATDRRVLGRGQFDGVYQLAKDLTRRYAGYIGGDDDPDDTTIDEMIVGFTKLKTLAEDWLKSDEAKWSNKDEAKKDTVTQIKEIEARGLLQSANITIFQLQNRRKLEDPAVQKQIEQLRAKRKDVISGKADARQMDAYRSLDAEVLKSVAGSFRPSNGTSEVDLIKGADGEVAYAFKSVAGESDMMGTDKGFATAREVMMSRLIGTLNEKYELGLGWPTATMAKVGGEKGALINGVKGDRAGTDTLKYEDVPAEALQKVVLCNLVGAQFDMKWEDVRFQRDGESLQPTCMDGGAAMPDLETVTTFMMQTGGKPGEPFIMNGVGQIYPEAQKKIDPAMVKRLLDIDTSVIRAELQAEAKRLGTDYQLDAKALGLDSGMDVAMTSIEGLQKILRKHNGDISLADLLQKYHVEVVSKKLVEPNQAAWEKKQLAEFAKIHKAHPGVFMRPDGYKSMGELYELVLHPEQRSLLKTLETMAQPGTVAALLKTYDVELPVKLLGGALAKIKQANTEIEKGLKRYDELVAKYPGLIVDKASFPKPLDAYLRVLQQKTHIESLEQLATQQNMGSVAELLRHHGYTVPTYDFKDKYIAIKKRLEQTPKQGTKATS